MGPPLFMISISELYKQYGSQCKFQCVALLLLVPLLITTLYYAGTSKHVSSSNVIGAQNWRELLGSKETLHLPWLRTLNPFIRKTGGDLVWNTRLQKGLMRFENLPVLKAQQNYRLWVYDLHQPQQKPVSASVFKVNKTDNNTFYVPIVPQSRITQPYKFLLIMEDSSDESISEPQSLFMAQP